MTTEEKIDRILESMVKLETNYSHCVPQCEQHHRVIFVDAGIEDNGDTMGLVAIAHKNHMHVAAVQRYVRKSLFAVVGAAIAAMFAAITAYFK